MSFLGLASAIRWEWYKASVRAKVEHPFGVIRRQFCYAKVRYRGLAKYAAQVLTLLALSNLWMARGRLLPAVWGSPSGRRVTAAWRAIKRV